MPTFETLAAILPADVREDRRITFVDGEQEQRTLDFRRLRQRALGALGALQRRGCGRGDRVVLFLADNERFLEMFWACVLGGMVPVPLAAGATEEHWLKLARVFAQLEPAWLCIDATALERLDRFVAAHDLASAGAQMRTRALTPGSLDGAGEPGQPASVEPDQLAFIQYSSGSTGEPKGVLLTHRNLTVNMAAIAGGAAYTDRDTALSWMPLSHDMGLIGFHLTLLAAGMSHAIMRTELFARRPLLWLDLASKQRTTVLCSPNFGYQHYLKQYAAKPPQGLDLAAVRLIFNGAEPISADLCRRFAATLAPHGLRPNSLLTVYGLAEASLAVSFPRLGAAWSSVALERAGMRVGEPVRPPAPGAQTTEFVKVGTAVAGTELRIVDDGGVVLAERVLGHVEIRGANVTAGFWRNEAATAAVRSTDGWLDTGDLGLVWDGQLVITGRAKDLVIVNGQNYYPHDLERIAEQVEGVEANRVAAAAVRSADGDAEALALFVLHRGDLATFVPKVLALRRTISVQAGLDVAQVVPVGRIPKTSSGKLQRYALARAYDDGEFDAVLAELAPLLAGAAAGPAGEAAGTPTVRRLVEICMPLVGGRQLTAQTHLLEIDLNSLTLARIHEAIDRDFPNRIEVTDLFDYPTLEQLAGFLDASAP